MHIQHERTLHPYRDASSSHMPVTTPTCFMEPSKPQQAAFKRTGACSVRRCREGEELLCRLAHGVHINFVLEGARRLTNSYPNSGVACV